MQEFDASMRHGVAQARAQAATPHAIGAFMAAAFAVAALVARPYRHSAAPLASAHVAPAAPVAASPAASSATAQVGGGRAVLLASVSAAQASSPTAGLTQFGEMLAYVQYKVMQAMTLPTWGKILTVMAVALPILALGSGALCAITGEKPLAAVKRCYFILNNVPGADIAGEEDVRAAVLLNTMYIVGLLTFAVLIGVLGDDIGSAVEAARLGNTRVPERNHTVVLGHNRQLIEVAVDSALDLLAHAWGTSEGAGASRLVASVSHLNNLARLQAQCAAQPGLSAVISCIMQQQPGLPEFYVQRVPEVVGLTYGETRRLFPRAVLAGFYDPRRAVVDRGAGVAGGSNAHLSAEERLDAEAVVVAAEDSEAARGTQRSREEQAQLRTSTVAGDPRSRAGLSAAGVQGADAVILTGLDGVSSDQADAQALATLLQLQALMPHHNQLHRHFARHAEGVEVYMRTPGALGLPLGAPIAWDTIQDSGRAHNVTVIGVPGDKLVVLAEEARLSHLAKETLRLSDPAGEFEVPPGAIYGVDVRLANVDDGQWWRGMLFKEVRC
eukprot:XP_001699058.1 predicted protein [Chlamydomonas reinhardtii]